MLPAPFRWFRIYEAIGVNLRFVTLGASSDPRQQGDLRASYNSQLQYWSRMRQVITHNATHLAFPLRSWKLRMGSCSFGC